MLLLGKIMILQGVGHPISCLGVCYANDPKKGGYMTPAPALDLTTSLRGDFGAFGARQFSLETLVGGRPGTTIFQNPGGGGGGGWGGGVAYKDRARPPPRGLPGGQTKKVTQRWTQTLTLFIMGGQRAF